MEKVIENGLVPYKPNTITNPDELRKELEKVRQQGFAVSTEELTEGTRSIAAPIRDYTGKVVCAITVVGPIEHYRS